MRWLNSDQKKSFGASKRQRGGVYDAGELLVTDCELLIPAATQNVITSRNVNRVKCRILAEGANGPTTSGLRADDVLTEKGVFVIISGHSG